MYVCAHRLLKYVWLISIGAFLITTDPLSNCKQCFHFYSNLHRKTETEKKNVEIFRFYLKTSV